MEWKSLNPDGVRFPSIYKIELEALNKVTSNSVELPIEDIYLLEGRLIFSVRHINEYLTQGTYNTWLLTLCINGTDAYTTTIESGIESRDISYKGLNIFYLFLGQTRLTLLNSNKSKLGSHYLNPTSMHKELVHISKLNEYVY